MALRFLMLALFLVSGTDARTLARGGAGSAIASRSKAGNSVRVAAPLRSGVHEIIMLDSMMIDVEPQDEEHEEPKKDKKNVAKTDAQLEQQKIAEDMFIFNMLS